MKKAFYITPDSSDYQLVRMNSQILLGSDPEEPTNWNDGSVDDNFNNLGEF